MDKIKFGLFDIFVYTIPGVVVCFAVYLFHADITQGLRSFTQACNKIVYELNAYTVILSFFISYLLGFVLHYFGYRYFGTVAPRLWKKSFDGRGKHISANEEKYVIVRHRSKENFVYVDQWNTYRGMSFNLSLSLLIVAIEVFVKMIIGRYFSLDWLLILLLLLLMSFVTLRRAVTFHMWSLRTLEESIKMLQETPTEDVLAKNPGKGDTDVS